MSHFKKPTDFQSKKDINQIKLEVIRSFTKEDSPWGFLKVRSLFYLIGFIVHKTKVGKCLLAPFLERLLLKIVLLLLMAPLPEC